MIESLNVVLATVDVEIVAVEVETGMSHQNATHVVRPLWPQLPLSYFIRMEIQTQDSRRYPELARVRPFGHTVGLQHVSPLSGL